MDTLHRNKTALPNPNNTFQIDLSLENGAGNPDSSTDFAPDGWPVIGALPPPTHSLDTSPSPPPTPTTNDTTGSENNKFEDILSNFKPGLLQNILSLAKQGVPSNNISTNNPQQQQPDLHRPPPSLVPPPIGGQLPNHPPPNSRLDLPPPVYNNGYNNKNNSHPDHKINREYDHNNKSNRDHDNHHNSSNRGHNIKLNHQGYDREGGYEPRGNNGGGGGPRRDFDHRGGGHHQDRRRGFRGRGDLRGRGANRGHGDNFRIHPCKFFFEGTCTKGEACTYSHVQ